MECIRTEKSARNCKRMHRGRRWITTDGTKSVSSRNFTRVIFEGVNL